MLIYRSVTTNLGNGWGGVPEKNTTFFGRSKSFRCFFLDPGRSISFRLGRISGTAIRYVALIRKQEKMPR